MAPPTEVKAPGMVPDELKQEPRSKGIATPRKKKPKELAVITECCTGCAGSPACVEYCPVEDCMFWVPDEDHPPFGRIQIDPILCIGCKKCLSKGPDGCFHDDGVPGGAIEEATVRALAKALLAAYAENRIDLNASEWRVVPVGNPKHAIFDRAVFNAGGRAGATGAAFGDDG